MIPAWALLDSWWSEADAAEPEWYYTFLFFVKIWHLHYPQCALTTVIQVCYARSSKCSLELLAVGYRGLTNLTPL